MTQNKSLAFVILAAGKGTRMKSDMPKVMHKIAGLPMVQHVIKAAEDLQADKIIGVVAPGMDDVKKTFHPHPCAIQIEQKGTGDALKSASDLLSDFDGTVIMLYGDVPLVSSQSLQMLVDAHQHGQFGVTIMAMVPPDPHGYGRIVQNEDGTLRAIVEQADANDIEKQIRLVNSGVMAINGKNLKNWLSQLSSDNAQGEYYATDLPAIAQNDGHACGVMRGDFLELRGVNSRDQLAVLEHHMQSLLRFKAMDSGVTLIDPESVYFSWDTKIGKDCTIEPNVFFGPDVVIGDTVIIHAFSHIEGAVIDDGATIGPFARIRPKSHIGPKATIGNFCEVNRSTLKAGAKSKHVSYLGDAIIGEKTNIGAGTVIANYDGYNKVDTVIGDQVFVGSNSTIIAPIDIADNAIIAGGSVITESVPKDAIALSRADQIIKQDAAIAYRKKKSALKVPA